MTETVIETVPPKKSTSRKIRAGAAVAAQAAIPALITVTVSFFAERALTAAANKISARNEETDETE